MRFIRPYWLRPCSLYTPPVASTEWVVRWDTWIKRVYLAWEDYQTYPLRGRRSRNKVSVGEPAEGSLTQFDKPKPLFCMAGTCKKMSVIFFTNLFYKEKNYKFENIFITKNKNTQRWISWFPYRWRTQRNAICNANCKIHESSNLWTQLAPTTCRHICISV